MKKFIGIIVSLFFMGWLVYSMRGDFPKIFGVLKSADRMLIAAGATLFFVGTVLMGLRLKLIFRAKGVHIGLARTVNLTLVGYFFNNFLPTSVGGDIVKALCAARFTHDRVKAFTTVMMDRIFGLFMFIIIPCASLFFLRGELDPQVPVTVYSFLALSIAFFFLLFNPSVNKRFHLVENLFNRVGIGTKIRQIYEELHDFKNHKGVVTGALLLSVAGQCTGIFLIYLFGVAVGADPSTWLYFFLLVPIVHLISMLPVSFGGLGIRESAYVLFLKGYIGAERAFAVGILWLALLLFYSFIGGLIYLFRHDYHVRFDKKPTGGTAAS